LQAFPQNITHGVCFLKTTETFLYSGNYEILNLIPFNAYEGSEFKRPEESAILNFKEILNKNNYTAIVRHSKGQDISAACGQLRANLMADG